MRIYRGYKHRELSSACALTIGNFDGVHRGHQAMLALLRSEAEHRGLPVRVMSFEPHPREYFAPASAPARISTLRDKLTELARCGVDEVVVLPFRDTLARQSAQSFIQDTLVQGLQVRYVLVGDDFRFGAKRAGDYAMLDAAGNEFGFDVARMNSYEVHGLRVSSSAVREALAQGQMDLVASLLGRRFSHAKAAASGIFVVAVHGLGPQPLAGVANLGVRPSLSADDVNGGRVLLETHILDWPQALGAEEAYGKIVRVELLHKLHDELKYEGLSALTEGIARDCSDARAWFASRHGQTHRQTTRDRI
jgi:riboflavin kinase/FMN adenylyltransferase